MASITGKQLFLSGFGSGGTDLTKTILNAHPEIHINDEIPHLGTLRSRGYDSDVALSDENDIQKLQLTLRSLDVSNGLENINCSFDEELAQGLEISRDAVLRKCFSTSGATIWGAKAPSDLSDLTSFAELFPEARFLVVTRDVRDVCLSWKRKWGKDVTWCAAKWASRMRAGWERARLLPAERCLFVKFEDLLTGTEATCRKICEFLQLPFSDRMVNHHQYTGQMRGKINYGRPIKADNMNKWRRELPPRTIRRIEEIAGETMGILGYPVEVATRKRPMTKLEKWRGVLRDSWSMLFVGNRASSANSFTRRLKTIQGVIRGLVLRQGKV